MSKEALDRKKLIKHLKDKVLDGEMSPKDELAYLGKIAELESYKLDKDKSVKYVVGIKFGGCEVMCGCGCDRILKVFTNDGKLVCLGGEIVKESYSNDLKPKEKQLNA